VTPPRPIIAGNWKMHHGPSATRDFFERLSGEPGLEGAELILFPPALSLAAALAARGALPVALGVQNVHWEERGAFTGELSPAMAFEAGATCALVGHSERRHLFGETDDEVGRKAAALRAAGLTPVVCVGETLDQRRAGKLEEVLTRQVVSALDALAGGSGRVLFAYEPVWAIGTGETATPADAASAHALVRARLRAGAADPDLGAAPILYGGSVRPDNAGELLAAPGVSGLLIGGASLDPAHFAAIARAGNTQTA